MDCISLLSHCSDLLPTLRCLLFHFIPPTSPHTFILMTVFKSNPTILVLSSLILMFPPARRFSLNVVNSSHIYSQFGLIEESILPVLLGTFFVIMCIFGSVRRKNYECVRTNGSNGRVEDSVVQR